jgi:hypothetical protein
MADESSNNTGAPEVTIFQLAGDGMFRGHRTDGTGWDWSWAERERPWMDASTNKFAYRCLPLSIANQTGWWVHNPVGFTAVWNGLPGIGSVKFLFDVEPELWSKWIHDQFGQGLVSWSVPFIFRTRPSGSRLLISGPVNSFKHCIQPLTAIIESDWMHMSFTMNWKITSAHTPVRFDAGEPIAQVIPVFSNIVAELERTKVAYMRLDQEPKMFDAFHSWCRLRDQYRADMIAGRIGDGWQKDYFFGRSLLDPREIEGHRTRLNPPPIEYLSPKP